MIDRKIIGLLLSSFFYILSREFGAVTEHIYAGHLFTGMDFHTDISVCKVQPRFLIKHVERV